MVNFQVGDKVHGTYVTNDWEGEPDGTSYYTGIIGHIHEDSSIVVNIKEDNEVLIEFYYGDTMELGDWTPLEKVLYNLK